MSENEDVIDRKGAWIERMFDRLYSAVTQNPWATLLVLSVGLNFMLISMNSDLQQARLDDEKKSNQEMIDEVRRSVQRETTKQIAPIKAQQDSIVKNVDTSLININGTVESVKKYFNKKK
ncbi:MULTISPECIES: hypothetical protein [unclassified Pedobacter]|uniref:hypothetical protein n=1 Tax=unclassified Pedobacter TaxID=2628915 RepID=UPI00141E3938|nr:MULTISPECIES: hypothetical protein [unclassified Pedobacter]NII81760.1 hypothetical protein [Pedobacter sp. SG908]NMN35762.1 hypothetical protein [Pedobacter sp. SG918]